MSSVETCPSSFHRLSTDLTPQRLELLQLIADGHTLQSAATRMHISVWTAKVHMRLIRRRLHARNRTHAVALAWRAGLIR